MKSPFTATAIMLALAMQVAKAQTDDRLSASIVTTNKDTGNTAESNSYPASGLHLNAFRKDNGIILNWTSEVTGKNIRYIIEYSTDASVFILSGVLNANKQKNYSFNDASTSKGAVYYRIKTETAGKVTDVSAPVSIASVEEQPYSIYPNPTDGDVYADLFNDFSGQMMRVIVRNSEGKICLSKQIEIHEKSSAMHIVSGRDGLKKGTYQVSMAFKNKTFSQSIEVK